MSDCPACAAPLDVPPGVTVCGSCAALVRVEVDGTAVKLTSAAYLALDKATQFDLDRDQETVRRRTVRRAFE